MFYTHYVYLFSLIELYSCKKVYRSVGWMSDMAWGILKIQYEILLKHWNRLFRVSYLMSLQAFPLSDCRGQWISIKQSSQQWQLQAACKSIQIKKTIRSGIYHECGRDIKMRISISQIYSMAQNECQLRAEYSILPVWHTEWAFQRQTWEENVCSCTVQQRPQRAPFHQNTGCSDHDGTMKIMTQMADKDRPCTPLCFLLPAPVSVFNFQCSTRTEEVK